MLIVKSGMPTSGNQKAGDLFHFGGSFNKKAGDSKYMLFLKSIMNRTIIIMRIFRSIQRGITNNINKLLLSVLNNHK